MTLYGWDASDFDHDRGPMDLAAAARAGISFFTHKYTEGVTTKHHPAAAMNAAKAAGIPFLGGYVVPRTPDKSGSRSIAKQADYLLAWADAQTPWWRTFPGWFWQVDTEHWAYDQVDAGTGAAMCAELRRRTGNAVLHYAPRWAYGDGIPGTDPLWASSYVSGSGDFKDLAAAVNASRWTSYSGRTPAVLQYTSSATIGRQPNCDANLFRGGLDDFANLIGTVTPSGGSLLEAVEGDVMFIGLVTGERWAVGPAGPVLVEWNEWTESFGTKQAGWPPVLILSSPDRVDQFKPAATSSGPLLSPEQVATLTGRLSQDLQTALAGEAGLTGAEVEQAVTRALAGMHLQTSFTAG